MATESTALLGGEQATIPTFTLKSTELGGQLTNQHYANGMGYTGANQSPPLHWEHAPVNTQGFALTMYDLDAPTGSGFWHWVVFNIPPHVHAVAAGAGDSTKNLLPEGAVQSYTDAGVPGYVGAAPNEGPAHRYLLTVHALSQKLNLEPSATPALVGFALHFSTLAKASLVVYGQKS